MNIPHTPTHFEIPADDPVRAKNFYEKLFGWTIQTAGPEFPDYFMVVTKDDPKGPGMNGGMMRRSNPGQQIINYINIENIDASLKKIEELGGKILMPKMPVHGMGWNAVAEDTEANVFGLWQEDKHAA